MEALRKKKDIENIISKTNITSISICLFKPINLCFYDQDLHSNGKPKTYIVQKYLDNPLLYNKVQNNTNQYSIIYSSDYSDIFSFSSFPSIIRESLISVAIP